MSYHIWNMRKSDINDNLVTFTTMQHIRLKIKQGEKIFLISSKVFSSFPLLLRELRAVDQVLITGGKDLWVTPYAGISPRLHL